MSYLPISAQKVNISADDLEIEAPTSLDSLTVNDKLQLPCASTTGDVGRFKIIRDSWKNFSTTCGCTGGFVSAVGFEYVVTRLDNIVTLIIKVGPALVDKQIVAAGYVTLDQFLPIQFRPTSNLRFTYMALVGSTQGNQGTALTQLLIETNGAIRIGRSQSGFLLNDWVSLDMDAVVAYPGAVIP